MVVLHAWLAVNLINYELPAYEQFSCSNVLMHMTDDITSMKPYICYASGHVMLLVAIFNGRMT